MLFDALLQKIEEDLRAGCDAAMASVRTQLEGALEDLAHERTAGLADVAKERAKGLAEVDKEKDELNREIATMQQQQGAQRGRIVLDIGGYRYTTSVETLRRIPGTFFDAYFSGRYTMDRSDDGSIFIDRNGEHFGQVLDYLRGGVMSVAEKDTAELDIAELHWLKREFGFYCIEPGAEMREIVFAVGGAGNDGRELSTVERYDVVSNAWRETAAMSVARSEFGLCALSDGELYASGGLCAARETVASVERYDPYLDAWCSAPALPRPRRAHCACTVGDAMYVISGYEYFAIDSSHHIVQSVLKFDVQTQTWSEVAQMPTGVAHAGACVLGNDIYMFGGRSTNDDEGQSTTYHFSTVANEWTTLAPLPEEKCDYGVCVLAGLIYLVGGEDSSFADLSSVHRFDPVENLWSTVAPMSVARSGLGVFVLDRSIYAVGGWGPSGRLSSMERYCVDTNRWSEVNAGNLGTGRSALSSIVIQLEIDLFDSLLAKATRKEL
jgi:hypothetical protein